MRALGWNPELMGSDWPLLESLDWTGAWVTGEAALAGYWLHHRSYLQTTIDVRPEAWERFLEQLPGPLSTLFPGCVRSGSLEVMRDAHEPFAPLSQDPIPASSLEDLAVDRWLQAFGSQGVAWLVDLYFLERARVDLEQAVGRMALRDAAATRRSLAVSLHRCRLTTLPEGLLRPVTLEQLEEFRRRWTDQLALELFS